MDKYFYEKESDCYSVIYFNDGKGKPDEIIGSASSTEKADFLCKAANAFKYEEGVNLRPLIEALDTLDRSEGSCFHSWQANIAMAFFGEWKANWENVVIRNDADMAKFFNAAAKRFLNLLIKQ